MLGGSATQVTGLNIYEIISSEDRSALRQMLVSLELGRRPQTSRFRLSRGKSQLVVTAAGFPMPESQDRFYLTLAHVRDADDLREASKPGQEADVDSTTGLLTPEAFSKRAAAVVSSHKGQADDHQSMTFLKVMGLKDLTLKLGKEGSQQLYRELGAVLAGASKTGDAAFFHRDNQFGVLHDASISVDSIREGLTEVLRRSQPEAQGISLSVLAEQLDIDSDGRSQVDMTRALAYAVNRFSATGNISGLKNLGDAIRTLMSETMTRIDMLRDLFGREGFNLVYQPIVSMQDAKIHHQEALTRVSSGTSPFEDVTFAEQIGMISELDIAVARRVLNVLSEKPLAFDIALNVSGRSLDSDIFAAQLLMLLRDNPNARRVVVEITESARIDRLDHANRIMSDIRKTGAKVYIDDFGSGAAGLHYVKAFEVDAVKIDGSLIRGIHGDVRQQALVRAISGVAVQLSMTTVAEMIETEAEAAEVRRCGVGFGQGYLYSRPREAVFERAHTLQTSKSMMELPRRRGRRTMWE